MTETETGKIIYLAIYSGSNFTLTGLLSQMIPVTLLKFAFFRITVFVYFGHYIPKTFLYLEFWNKHFSSASGQVFYFLKTYYALNFTFYFQVVNLWIVVYMERYFMSIHLQFYFRNFFFTRGDFNFDWLFFLNQFDEIEHVLFS